jgi:hypothetical protein
LIFPVEKLLYFTNYEYKINNRIQEIEKTKKTVINIPKIHYNQHRWQDKMQQLFFQTTGTIDKSAKKQIINRNDIKNKYWLYFQRTKGPLSQTQHFNRVKKPL